MKHAEHALNQRHVEQTLLSETARTNSGSREPLCFDGRAHHTFRSFADETHSAWWCDYCGELFDRRPSETERQMTPGTSP